MKHNHLLKRNDCMPNLIKFFIECNGIDDLSYSQFLYYLQSFILMKLDVLFHIIFYSDFVLFSKLISHIHKKLHGCDTINL